jgi:hypothetical protein
VGRGERCFFWINKWINGKSIEESVPVVFQSINPRTCARHTVASAMNNGLWIDDIKKNLNIKGFQHVLGALSLRGRFLLR